MKNLKLLRLAGFGFFGAVFLSPSPEQNEWLLERLTVAKTLTSFSFNLSALYRENNITESKTEEPPSSAIQKPNILFSLFIQEPPAYDSLLLSATAYDLSMPAQEPGADSSECSQLPDPENFPVKTTVAEVKLPRSTCYNQQSEPVLSSDYENHPNAANTPELVYENITEGTAIEKTHLPQYSPDQQAMRELNLLPPKDFIDMQTLPAKKETQQVASYSPVPIITTEPEAGLNSYPANLMQERIVELTDYAEKNDYSTDYAFMINLGLKSGKKRFFLVDLKTGNIVNSGLVAHGRGKEKFTLNKRYSNMSGSSCSSLGLYKVGAAYYGSFGKSFRLVGLEKTNNNALSRAIVLHAMGCIPNEEIDYPICQSEGCPSLSPEVLEKISPVIKKSEKPMLLWIFDPTIEKKYIP